MGFVHIRKMIVLNYFVTFAKAKPEVEDFFKVL